MYFRNYLYKKSKHFERRPFVREWFENAHKHWKLTQTFILGTLRCRTGGDDNGVTCGIFISEKWLHFKHFCSNRFGTVEYKRWPLVARPALPLQLRQRKQCRLNVAFINPLYKSAINFFSTWWICCQTKKQSEANETLQNLSDLTIENSCM